MKNRYTLFTLALLATGLLISCAADKDQIKLVELDLMGQGMPIMIMAPEEPVVEVKKLGVYRVASVKKGTEYHVEVFESNAVSRDKAVIKARLLNEVQGNPYFQKVVVDEESGFIYENAVDSNYINFGFRYLKLQGDKEYVYQTGIGKQFTLDQVEQMYEGVKAVD
jgi:hypothetical protein